VASCCKHGNEQSGSLKCGEFLTEKILALQELVSVELVSWFSVVSLVS
jgi:hypothetical protein